MHTINVLKHTDFDETMLLNGWCDTTVESLKDTAFISICCQPEIKKNYLEDYKEETDEHWFRNDLRNVLNVDFDDIEEEFTDTQYGKAIGISEDTAAKIKTFIDEMYNNGVKNWYIHCRSGKSRSVAVGIYLIEYLLSHNESYKDNDFKKEHANKRVLKLIRDCDA